MPLMMSQHWSRWWLGAIRHQAMTWANVDPDLYHHMASLGHNGLIEWILGWIFFFSTCNTGSGLITHMMAWVQDCSNSLADMQKLLQSCTKPSIWISIKWVLVGSCNGLLPAPHQAISMTQWSICVISWNDSVLSVNFVCYRSVACLQVVMVNCRTLLHASAPWPFVLMTMCSSLMGALNRILTWM